MRIFIVLSLLCFLYNKSQAQTDTIEVNHTKFITLTKGIVGEYNGKDTVMYLYRIEGNTKKYLLKHNIHSTSGDCNNSYTDKGKYYIEGNNIVFIEEYFQEGRDPIPTSKKQIYKVDGLGKLHLIFEKLYFDDED